MGFLPQLLLKTKTKMEEIFKIQISEFTSDGKRRVFIYNMSRSVIEEFEATSDVLLQANGRKKFFMWGFVNHARKLVLSRNAPWQHW